LGHHVNNPQIMFDPGKVHSSQPELIGMSGRPDLEVLLHLWPLPSYKLGEAATTPVGRCVIHDVRNQFRAGSPRLRRIAHKVGE